ncbi:MAG: DUF4345 family protein [Gammaproteobacteria bacterium]
MLEAHAAALAVAGAFASMGIAGLLRPGWLASLVGIATTTPLLRNEVRAVYGGFGCAVALALAWSTTPAAGALGPGMRLATAVALLGMVGGRLLSFAVERAGRLPWAFALGELGAAALLLDAWN